MLPLEGLLWAKTIRVSLSNITQTPHISHIDKLEVFLQKTIRISLSNITQTPHISHIDKLEVFFTENNPDKFVQYYSNTTHQSYR